MPPVILRKRTPYIGQPEIDRYSQADRKKTTGYPKGQATMFLHGRLLRDCIFPRFEVISFSTAGTTVNNAGNLNFLEGGIIPDERACFIMGVSAGPVWQAQDNIWAAWQIWENGKYLDGSVVGKWYHPVNKYVSPNSRVTFYTRQVNGTLLTAEFRFSVQFVTFNATLDVWEFGRANLRDNPSAVTLVY